MLRQLNETASWTRRRGLRASNSPPRRLYPPSPAPPSSHLSKTPACPSVPLRLPFRFHFLGFFHVTASLVLTPNWATQNLRILAGIVAGPPVSPSRPPLYGPMQRICLCQQCVRFRLLGGMNVITCRVGGASVNEACGLDLVIVTTALGTAAPWGQKPFPEWLQ